MATSSVWVLPASGRWELPATHPGHPLQHACCLLSWDFSVNSNPQTRQSPNACIAWENPEVTASWGTPSISGRRNQMGGFSPLRPMEGWPEMHFMYFLGGQSLRIRRPVIPCGSWLDTNSSIGPPTCLLPLFPHSCSLGSQKKYHPGPFNSLLQGIQSAIAQICLILKTTPASWVLLLLRLNLQDELASRGDAHGLWHLDDPALFPSPLPASVLTFFDFICQLCSVLFLALGTCLLFGECSPLPFFYFFCFLSWLNPTHLSEFSPCGLFWSP